MIDSGANKLFVRRNERGTSFRKVVDAGRSIAADKCRKAEPRFAPARATAANGPANRYPLN
jgi:hypothetical protein